jgi:hypothetical protein
VANGSAAEKLIVGRTASIPRYDDAALVELKDRIVGHWLDQVPEAPFAFEKAAILMSPLMSPLHHVARDLGKADQLTVVFTHGIDYGQSPEAGPILSD